jgi:hypothetical protein
MPSKLPGIDPSGNAEMNTPMSSVVPSRSESMAAERIGVPASSLRTDRDDWTHEFRNALGNITIAASAAKGELADNQSQQVSALMRQIEEGCERCLRLLRTMPR